MNISEPFIRKPVATTLLTIAIALAGAAAYELLPVSRLPNVDFPTIHISAGLPGGSPETMASSVATPLERQFAHIAGVTEMTSTSSLASSSIVLQFDLNRNINAAGRDVEAAINAARGYMPANLPTNPRYRAANPADSPIFQLVLSSKTLTKGQVYDVADSILLQKFSQIKGVGEVIVGGGSPPAVRIELNPMQLNKYGIGLEQVRRVLMGANANVPKGYFSDGVRTWQVGANDQIFKAIDYKPLIIAYRNGSAVRISDVGQAIDSVQDVRNAGYATGGVPCIQVIVWRQPGANVIAIVNRIRAALPYIRAAMPRSIHMAVRTDESADIRLSVDNVEITLIIAVILVILVVFVFLRSARTTLIPGIAIPVSIISTFGVMYLFGYSLDNLSLMALTICTGFVVDDAIVVTENISRYLEQGLDPFRAALKGSKEISSTVFTISISLVTVFTPLLLMQGIVGRLFHEFAVTLAAAILISMVVSLTTTPTMCAYLLKQHESHGRLYRATDRAFNGIVNLYGRTLSAILKVPAIALAVLLSMIALTIFLYIHVPKGFFPEQDNGRIEGSMQADQDTSFQAMNRILLQMIKIVSADPAVSTVHGLTGSGGGGATLNTARIYIMLKPLAERKSALQIIARLRPKLARVPGATLYMQPEQDVQIGGRQTNAQYQYTLVSDNLNALTRYAPLMLQQLETLPMIVDVNSDQQNRGLQSYVQVDRATAARFGISSQLIDNTLYDAFGQREVSTMYEPLNQYHVVMEVAPQFWQSPRILRDIYVDSPAGQEVPLSAIAHFAPANAPLDVNHQGLFPAVTISFNLRPGVALGDAVNAINAAATKVGLPSTIQTGFAGTAQAYQQSLSTEPLLIAAALVAVYLVLGILYESYIHPVTILSTLPSAGVGALLALMITHTDLTVIAVIGIILLIGLVEKNGILMVDFALAAERNEGRNSRDAIHEACLLRFRPILMTTMAAILGAVPLAMGTGMGSELRRPLGIAIIGGLMVSQVLTLYTTPVIYLYFDRLQHWWDRVRGRSPVQAEPLSS